jgi:hypothetical protein
MARMVEASEWLAHVREEDRRLVVLVLVYLAKGEKKVPWLKLTRRLGVGMGLTACASATAGRSPTSPMC